jgi:hypothetical protein
MGFQEEYRYIAQLLEGAPEVDVGEWQAIRGDIPQAKTIEVEDVTMVLEIPETIEGLQRDVKPNLPWDEHHFADRVG